MIEEMLGKTWAIEARFGTVMAKKLQNGNVGSFDAIIAQHKAINKPTAVNSGGNSQKGNTNNVAIINIIGSMTRYGGLCTYGTEQMASWIIEANKNETIDAIVLNINSPGGEVDGTELMANAIKNSKKPVVAYVAGMGASAAYWVASQCRSIVMESATISEVGSIGVLCMHLNSSEFYKKEGHEATFLRSDGSDDKAVFNSLEPLTDSIVQSVKADLNRIKKTFETAVKKARPQISNDVFTGKMYSGKEAIKLGMADSIGYLGDAVKVAMSLVK